jgi:adenylate cyclase
MALRRFSSAEDDSVKAKYTSPQEEWAAYLNGTHQTIKLGRRTFRLIPIGPRCKMCSVPFAGVGKVLLSPFGWKPWEKNPNLCTFCVRYLNKQDVSGAEVDVSFLFADVRRSSELARRVGTMEFTRLMQRFYDVATEVLFAGNGIIEKFVGDEVVGFFVPLLTGPNHAAAAVKAAEQLLRETGHADANGPWLPLGAGVHTGVAFVGMVSRGSTSDFTAFGDPINVAAHVASQAVAGEILITDAAASAGGVETGGLERRRLELKGVEMNAVILPVHG